MNQRRRRSLVLGAAGTDLPDRAVSVSWKSSITAASI